MYSFNPFRKSLKKIEAKDLMLLRDVAEGWYVDYKRESIKIKEIAKHISAFSNQYGGFLCFGIVETEDGTRKAGSFPGIPREEIEPLSTHIREAAVAHVSPPVYYEEHIVDGPCEDIGLPENKAILILGIPQGDNPPYIHSSGRIYRRLADQSKPKEETNRYVLDDLWRRGKEGRDLISKFLRKIPELPSAQAESVWAFIHLMPNVNFPSTKNDELSFEQFRSYTVQAKDNIVGVSMPMQSVFSVKNGFIARQVGNNDPGLANPTFRWWNFGAARFDIPVNTWIIKDFLEKSPDHKYSSAFIAEVYKQDFKDIQICDFSMLIQCIASLLNTYCHLRKEINDTRPVYATYELRNAFYTIPFVDSKNYIERCSSNGIPVIQDRSIVLSEEPYFDNMISLSDFDKNKEDLSDDKNQLLPYVSAAPIAYRMLNSIGALCEITQLAEDTEIWGHHKLNNPNY